MTFISLFFALFNMFAPIHHAAPHAVPHTAMRPMDTIGGGLPNAASTPMPASTSINPMDTIGGGLPN